MPDLLSGTALRIVFTIPGSPVAQPRPRATVRAGHAAVYEAKKTHPIHAFKALAKLTASQSHRGAPLSGPIRVDAVFVFPRPQSMIWKTRPMPRERHAKKPDRDNCDKALLDSLKGIIFADDCQACAGTIEKWIAAGNEQPHVLVTVTEL